MLLVSGHRDIPGNELANKLSGKDSATLFTGPELGLAITKSAICRAVTEWFTEAHQVH